CDKHGVILEAVRMEDDYIRLRKGLERDRMIETIQENIRGGLHDFSEVFPDEGEMDFLEIIRILRDYQYPGALTPDHMPSHPDDPDKLQAFAFGFGYIKALIHAANSEV
ncbi:MAG: hypothetical protein ACYS74_11070, partial [Planctomycetota bacterium]